MTADQIWGIARTILAAGAGFIVAKGYVDDATATAIIGAIGTIFVAIWSVVSKRNTVKTA